MTLLEDLPHRCTIRKRRHVKDDLGGGKSIFITTATSVACWEQQASNREVELFDKRNISATRKIYFKTDPGINEQYEILVTSLDRGITTLSNPIALEVVSESEPDAGAGLGVVYKVFCNRITGTTQ